MSTGGAHSRVEASITSPTFPLMSVNNSQLCSTHSHRWHLVSTACSTNGKLHIPVKAQPNTPSTWPLSPTRLGIRLQDLGLPNECTLGHCGFSAASRHQLPQAGSTHYSQLPTLQQVLICGNWSHVEARGYKGSHAMLYRVLQQLAKILIWKWKCTYWGYGYVICAFYLIMCLCSQKSWMHLFLNPVCI